MAGISSIPTEQHFAVIREESVYIPGDERSRTHPGHGYPASTETYVVYEAFQEQAAWERRIADLTSRRERFRAISAAPAKVSTSVSVTVS
jgi:hypothetical protein